MSVVRLRFASSFPPALASLAGVATDLAALLAEVTDGGLGLDIAGGEPPAPAALLAALQDGRLDIAHTAGSFLLDRDPVLALATFAPFGLDARRQRSWLATAGQGHAAAAWARLGLVAIACGNTGAQTGGWYKTPIGRPENLAGLRIRTAGLPALVLAELGAEPVAMAARDILPALRDGRLDAADWIGPADDLAMGFHTVAPVYHHPGVMEPNAALSLVMRADAFAALPPAHRAALALAAAGATERLAARYDAANPPALAALVAEGARLEPFPRAVLVALRQATDVVLERLVRADAAFAAALADYRAFADAGTAWQRLGELGVRTAIEGPAEPPR